MNLVENINSFLVTKNIAPLSIHESGADSYVISGLYTLNDIGPGYYVMKFNSGVLNYAFLLESTRVSGSNGTPANINIKTDTINTLLLLEELFAA